MMSTHQSDSQPPVGGVEPEIRGVILVDAVQYHPPELILVPATNQITELYPSTNQIRDDRDVRIFFVL